MGLEVGRVYGCVLVVPGHKQRSSLHCRCEYGSGPFDRGVLGDVWFGRGVCSLRAVCWAVWGAPGKSCSAVRCGAVRCVGCVRRERFAIIGKRHSECQVVPGGNKAPGQEASERVRESSARQLTTSDLERLAWLVACDCAHMASAIQPRARPNPNSRAALTLQLEPS